MLPASAHGAQGPRTALLIGSNRTTLHRLRSYLEMGAYRVVQAAGAHSVTVAQWVHPDVIVLDADAPDHHLSAREVCQWLRAEPATAGIPIVAVGSAERLMLSRT